MQAHSEDRWRRFRYSASEIESLHWTRLQRFARKWSLFVGENVQSEFLAKTWIMKLMRHEDSEDHMPDFHLVHQRGKKFAFKFARRSDMSVLLHVFVPWLSVVITLPWLLSPSMTLLSPGSRTMYRTMKPENCSESSEENTISTEFPETRAVHSSNHTKAWTYSFFWNTENLWFQCISCCHPHRPWCHNICIH